MKDLPLSTILPITLETAEMSSDVDELSEGFDRTDISTDSSGYGSLYYKSAQTPPMTRRPDPDSNDMTGRRSSLPNDQPASCFRRTFNQLKARRKSSAPCPPQAPIVITKLTPILPSSTNPLAVMTGSPLIDLLEKFRPRQSSTSDSGVGSIPTSMNDRGRVHRRCSDTFTRSSVADEGTHSTCGDEAIWKPLFVDTKLANSGHASAPATVPRQCLYYKHASMNGSLLDSQHNLQRRRSNSETGRYLLMRKSGDLNGGSEVVGRLEAEWAYCQILASMRCYDLMPSLSKMVVVDANLTVNARQLNHKRMIRKAFHALVQNDIRAAPIWDGQRQLFTGLLTATDLIRMLIEYASNQASQSNSELSAENEQKPIVTSFEDMLNLPLHKRTTVQRRESPRHCSGGSNSSTNNQRSSNHLIYALADESVSKAAKLLCDRRLHRLLIVDPEKGGNPLFLLTKRDVLKALQKYIAKLPLPTCMEKTLDELGMGTWFDLVTVSPDTTLHEALCIFLEKGLSSLPVVDENYHIVDMLTKVDVLNLVIENQGPIDGILKRTVADATQMRKKNAEKMTTCSKKATLLLAVECMLHSNAHRLAIVDSDGKLEGILALVDLMRFLINGYFCE